MRKINFLSDTARIGALLMLIIACAAFSVIAQNKKNRDKTSALKSGKYRNVFLEAGYNKTDIDNKLNKAYYDVFEGPTKVYFEVGDSMGYVSDVKNHDARTEGLSYGMMIAVQLNKKDVFDRIWRWSKKYLQHQDGPCIGLPEASV